MLPLKSSDLIAFTPKYYHGVPDAPVYYIKPADGFEKAKFTRALAYQNVKAASYPMVLDELEKGIKACLTEDTQDDALYAIQLWREGGHSDPNNADLKQDFQDIVKTIEPVWPPYREKVADWQYYLEVMPQVATMLLLKKVDSASHTIELRNGQVTPESLSKLPSSDVAMVGMEAFSLMHVSKEQEKNSE